LAVWQNELNSSGERFTGNLREPLVEFLETDAIRKGAGDLTPTTDPGATKGTIPVEDKQRPVWRMLDQMNRR